MKLKELPEVMQSKEAREVMARAMAERVRSHLLQLNKERHRGLYLKGFYARAAESVGYEIKGAKLSVTIGSVGIRQRRYGGPIVPKNAKALTIPNWKQVPETASRGAREFKGLFLIKLKNGMAALAQGSKGAKGKKGKLRVFYWLVRKVVQSPDPSVLPDSSEMAKAAAQALLNFAKSKGAK